MQTYDALMFLTKDQLHELTGYQNRPQQITWLRSNGYPFEIGADGRPRVLTATVLAKLGAPAPQSRPQVRIPKRHEAA
ncbi:DUF4224 domain-containing protein [Acidithiobacillus ferridurans]|jgi:hypothetical protein|uniref:DUF4224 domain-containing protein n=1 Tax=Acidithiobacillus ferrooxidans TaxID=920 RepID=UPI000ACDBEDF|nr:DUF4224 domain-containing protein [Acidithiobacillus ferrooxidans]MBU2720393.1 DUF4224 domain-containing protein [Acidithiobacillus ferridurans]